MAGCAKPATESVSARLLDRIDDAADRFEAAWKCLPRPCLAEFLREESPDNRLPLLIELVKLWARG